MSDLFLEIFSEEIPARLQLAAQRHLKKFVRDELLRAKSGFEAIESFSTPQRLILIVKGLKKNTLPEFEENGARVSLRQEKRLKVFANR